MLRVAFLVCWFVVSTTPILSESSQETGASQETESSQETEATRKNEKKYFFPPGRPKGEKKSFSIRRNQKNLEEEKKNRTSPERISEHIKRFIKQRHPDLDTDSDADEAKPSSSGTNKPKIWTAEEHRAYIDGIKAEKMAQAGERRLPRRDKDDVRDRSTDRLKDWKERMREGGFGRSDRIPGKTDARAEWNRIRDRSMLHTFDIRDSNDDIIRLDSESFPDGRIFLIVNTASECDFTHQYAELEELYQRYKDKGLRVVAFPSNSFDKEPGGNAYIQSFVKEHYKVSFPVMGKCDVNGPDAPEIYGYLKSMSTRRPKIPDWAPLEKTGLWEKDIQWNFEKFLVWAVDGIERFTRFGYDVPPMHIETYVLRALRRLDTVYNRRGRRNRKEEL